MESLEPPRVVQVRCIDMVTKDNLYGQVTVRMHTRQVRVSGSFRPAILCSASPYWILIISHSSQQTLAIYDRFGRLMYGGEEIPKDVLEYVVLERHLVNPYGAWRLHGKIVPPWAPSKDCVTKVLWGCYSLTSVSCFQECYCAHG